VWAWASWRHTAGQFYLFVNVTGAEAAELAHTIEIASSSPYDDGDPGQRTATWSSPIAPNAAQLTVNQEAWTWDPLPGQDYVYSVRVCNDGETGTTAVTVTDTLPLATTLVSWWGEQPGWSLVSSSAGEVVVSRPALPGHWCDQVNVRVHLNPAAQTDTQLTNTVSVAADNDLDTSNNTNELNHNPGTARHNLGIDKDWDHGQLTPGGEAHYWISFGNRGNVPVTHPADHRACRPA
jgi:uncharacterized repeat protein (TIGR01451 family)